MKDKRVKTGKNNQVKIWIHSDYGILHDDQLEYYNGQRIKIKFKKGESHKDLEKLQRFLVHVLKDYEG